ncbi:MAG: tRNA pseudouridine(38-40) synthase TruA [Actinomycetales bacterium]
MRIRLDLGYDGTAFSGWAAQPGRRTVEGELTGALRAVLRDPLVRLTVAGRTDAGVHARGQVAHLNVDETAWGALPGRGTGSAGQALVRRLAGLLPPDVVVHEARPVSEDFDARFAALWRRYSYRLADASSLRDPLRRADTAAVRDSLDVGRMDAAARTLVGLHDFAAFCKLAEGRSSVRTLLAYGWTRDQDGVLVGTVQADAFCHSMVRFLVGAAVAVGSGRREIDWPAGVLASRQRDSAAVVMPARGLCLERVEYPPPDALAERISQTRAVRALP